MCIYEKNNSSNPHYSSWFHNYSCCTWHSQPQRCTNLPVEESPTTTEPAECSCEGVLGRTQAWTRGNSQRPWVLGTVRRSVKWKATCWTGGQIPYPASVLRPNCPALCAPGHSHGWAQIRFAPRTAEVLPSKKKLYEAHSGVFFCHPQAQHSLCKGEAWVSHCGGHWGSPREAPGKKKGKQGLVRSRRGQCLGHPWHEGIGPKLFTSQSN